MSNGTLGNSLQPHPELVSYYRESEDKRRFLRNIFDETAVDYDRVERLLSIGSGGWYRRQALLRAGLLPAMRVLDVATGTGLVAREAARIVGPLGRVIGVDPSSGMLNHAPMLRGFRAVVGRGECLPVADAAFDFVSMGYALRHLLDLRIAFAEFFRVLRPGGRLCMMEITRPTGAIGRHLLHAYFRLVLPVAARATHTSAETRRLWQYYWETIEQCVAPQVVMQALADVGFGHPARKVVLGLFSEYVARKPA